MNKLATILLCANFVTVLFPQPGYIHPDEFFQSSEIVAGDVLGVQHFRVWEFNGTSAVRNIVFPYLVISPSLYLLRWINSTGISEFQLSAVKVVMATRLPISFLSSLGYIATGRLADVFKINRYVSTVLYCSSYVTWTYYTRTFSNSVESVLLAVVLLLVLTLSGGPAGDGEKSMTLASDLKCEAKSECKEKGDKNKTETDKQLLADRTELDKERKPKLNVTTTKNKTEHARSKSKKENSEKKTEKEGAEEIKKSKAINEKIVKEVLDKTGKEMPADSEDVTTDEAKEQKSNKIEMELRWKEKNDEISRLRGIIAKLVSFLLGAVVTAGFFNRPTFLVFATVPVIYWVWSVTRGDCYGRWHGVSVISIVFIMSSGAIFTFVTFVLLDTLYFNPEFLTVASKLLKSCMDGQASSQTFQAGLQTLASSLVVTPWNFITYNSNVNNLAQHGLHPRFTHFLVNLPLLLGPLYVLFVIFCFVSICHLLKKSESSNKNMAWLTFMALVPVLALSVFPHQEPRFLIPALPVFVVMGAKIISGVTPGKLSFFALWTVFNIFLTLVYGYMHQAALIPALSIYQQKLSSHTSSSYHAIFYHTYSPPRHLLLLHPDNSRVSIHELAGAPIDTFVQTLKQVQDTCERSTVKCRIFVFLPSTVTPRVLGHLSDNKVSTTSICPHLSMEAPPRLWAWWKKRLSFDDVIMDFCLNILTLG